MNLLEELSVLFVKETGSPCTRVRDVFWSFASKLFSVFHGIRPCLMKVVHLCYSQCERRIPGTDS